MSVTLRPRPREAWDWVAAPTQQLPGLEGLLGESGVAGAFPLSASPAARCARRFLPAWSRKSGWESLPDAPWTRYHARDLLERAEKLAGLDPIDGGDFHPYRRKWATERKHLPTQDVMEARGWLDPGSLQAAYQQAVSTHVSREIRIFLGDELLVDDVGRECRGVE